MLRNLNETIFNAICLKLMTAIFLDSLPCSKDCGPGGTCLRELLMYKHPAECRCDKGFKKTKDGECVGGCSFKENIIFNKY